MGEDSTCISHSSSPGSVCRCESVERLHTSGVYTTLTFKSPSSSCCEVQIARASLLSERLGCRVICYATSSLAHRKVDTCQVGHLHICVGVGRLALAVRRLALGRTRLFPYGRTSILRIRAIRVHGAIEQKSIMISSNLYSKSDRHMSSRRSETFIDQ